MKQACLCYAAYGTCAELTQQVIDRALISMVVEPNEVRSQEAFESMLEHCRTQWVNQAQAIAKHVIDAFSVLEKSAYSAWIKAKVCCVKQ